MEIETDEPGSDSEVGADFVDADGDGYLSQVDCNDQDVATHPGAEDVPVDGVDQDCDGGDATTTTASVDADGDGFPAAVDCNDNDASVYPGAADPSGDGVDQDSNGVDNPPEADGDGDGHANETYAGDDCDDSDASVHPGAVETRGDDFDSDCDGADFGVDQLVADPDAVDDGDGEWFELYNAAGHSENLEGLIGSDDAAFAAADIFTVTGAVVAGVGDRLVFAVSDDTTVNGGITADYDYSGGGVNLNNSGDEIYVGVLTGGVVLAIDSVVFSEVSSWPAVKGASLELKGTAVTSTANDAKGNWCAATGRAGTTTDNGSPGAASSGC